MITKEELIAMQEYYAAKRRALVWYEQAMKSVNNELMLKCLFCWQECADEATFWWRKVSQENQILLTLIASGYGGKQ